MAISVDFASLNRQNNNEFTLQYTSDAILEISILGENEILNGVGSNGGAWVAEMASGREKGFSLLFFGKNY